jgi:hypothetical protein
MKKTLVKSNFIAICLLAFLVCSTTVLTSCGSSKNGSRSGRKIQKGKPIPCPIKDC